MDKDKITRLKIILKHLKETKGLNQGQVASMIGLTSGAITKMLKNERAITIKTMLLFEHVHDISSEWFTSGQGEMILKKKGESRLTGSNQELFQKILKRKGMVKLLESLLNLTDSQLSAVKNIIDNFKN
ncbi:DNA-binding helix-turn-helix protein [Leptospira kirschneri str. 200803703]|uniref:DNA-binding helix-turn-helix protein n=1 Tax=Leptospira kirschneri str. 200802841 TaxID=1193047 RepID=A0A828Y225_9LEPT|nr:MULTISPECIES: helix-turn-helix transcriptional regulator [Leptospira]EMO74418.1 DNA-binding helix-turn-helix protein [Leptospira kirschneri str. 200801925]EJP15417.1 DNA-binding helix-turn-helix protein [Leptospira interrogans str. FPW2026]EKO53592.1 DNA-binding helix-turn-helix protein [Leptospira kirschneri str. 200802841]EKP87387.1 DNA-binding helix-turn-helix protein [Leptospira interrogans serovar Grippotyphosa str. 2006006986]EMJ94084.1 DNA-binding helix-turn-helix protein [Leptospira